MVSQRREISAHHPADKKATTYIQTTLQDTAKSVQRFPPSRSRLSAAQYDRSGGISVRKTRGKYPGIFPRGFFRAQSAIGIAASLESCVLERSMNPQLQPLPLLPVIAADVPSNTWHAKNYATKSAGIGCICDKSQSYPSFPFESRFFKSTRYPSFHMLMP